MSDVLSLEMFEFVLANELKRAARSQNFVTLVVMEPRGDDRTAAVREIASLMSREVRETDLLATDEATVSMVLLDTDLHNARRVLERVTSRLQHYQFTAPVGIVAGAACCPTDGCDIDTLRRAAMAERTELPRQAPHGTARAQ